MATDLTRIGDKARQEPTLVFTTLYHHITDVDNLRACYDRLPAHKASGVDGVTKAEYGEHLEEHLRDLSARLKRQGYRPAPKRRTYVPKAGSAKGRPRGISNLEDKIVEAATRRTLEPIFEAVFEDSSYGYRPGRSPHQCLDALGRTLQQQRVAHVVEADIKSYFDTVNHAWLVRFLRHRIGDERVIRLVIRMLKSGILEDGLVQATEQGTPQGSMLSPLLSNIYLHYVLDLWFSRRVRPGCRGEAYYFRFADDFLACFQYQGDAEWFRPPARRPARRLRAHPGGRQDAGARVRALCPCERVHARRETERVYLSGLHPLWWQDPGGLLQGETSHQPEEAGAKLAAVHGLGASRSQCPAEGGDVPVGPRPRGRPSALLRHHG